jgi:hypothetical protein
MRARSALLGPRSPLASRTPRSSRWRCARRAAGLRRRTHDRSLAPTSYNLVLTLGAVPAAYVPPQPGPRRLEPSAPDVAARRQAAAELRIHAARGPRQRRPCYGLHRLGIRLLRSASGSAKRLTPDTCVATRSTVHCASCSARDLPPARDSEATARGTDRRPHVPSGGDSFTRLPPNHLRRAGKRYRC